MGFLQWSISDLLAILQGRLHTQEQLANTKQILWVLCVCFGIFCLIGFLFVLIFLRGVCMRGEGERENESWVGRKVERVWEELGEGKHH